MESEQSFADGNPTADATAVPVNRSNDNGSTNRFDPNELYYDMSSEKFLLIFNHRTYKKTEYFHNTRPSDREGTEEDVNSLKSVFQKMHYKVLVYNDFVYDDIMKTIKNISKQDHSRTSCLCIAILTHGDKNEMVYAADMPYTLRDITVKLENGDQGLVGKPKIFFIQACRGGQLDVGRKVQIDGTSSSMKIPSTADFLFLRSSVEGYISFRNINGSFLIQELCNALENNYDKDIHYITTIVNRNIAYHYITTSSDSMINNKKQMPEVRHTLTKFYKF